MPMPALQSQSARSRTYWHTLGSYALLVPEAVLIVVVTGIAFLSTAVSILGILGLILMAMLIVRIMALYLGRRAFVRGQLQEADTLSRMALLLHPFSADALALRGSIELADGNIDKGLEYLERSAQLLMPTAVTLAALSGAYLLQGRFSEAHSKAQAALALDTSCVAAYLCLAEIQQQRGDSPYEIEDTLREALKVAHTANEDATARCALAAHLINEQRQAEARLMLSGIEPLIEDCSVAVRNRMRLRYGELLIAQGRSEHAQAYLQEQLVMEGNGYQSAAWRAGLS